MCINIMLVTKLLQMLSEVPGSAAESQLAREFLVAGVTAHISFDSDGGMPSTPDEGAQWANQPAGLPKTEPNPVSRCGNRSKSEPGRAGTDPNPNLAVRNRSESAPGRVITDPNPNLTGTKPIRIRTQEKQSEAGARGLRHHMHISITLSPPRRIV